MNKTTLKAHAKINLSLEIVGKRADGYHNIKSVIQSIELHDVVHIRRNNSSLVPTIRLECTNASLPTDHRNIAYRAAEFMIKQYDLQQDISITIEKNIPIEAGLGGGSADCAAVLTGIRDSFSLPLDNVKLAEIGKQFGADVPFCIYGGTMLAEGIGDILTPLPDFLETHILLAKPPWGFSTKKMYQQIHCPSKRDADDRIFYNAFEYVEIKGMDVIHQIKAAMIDNGATASLMSGAGSAVFGLFEDCETMETAAKIMQSKFEDAVLIKTKVAKNMKRD